MTPDSNLTLTPSARIADARAKADALWHLLCQTQVNLSARGFQCVAQALAVYDQNDVARMMLSWLPCRRQLDEFDVLYRTYTIEITVSPAGVTHFSGLPTLPLTLQSQPSGAASLDEVQAWGRLAMHEFENITRKSYDARFPPTLPERAFAVAADLFARMGLPLKGAR